MSENVALINQTVETDLWSETTTLSFT